MDWLTANREAASGLRLTGAWERNRPLAKSYKSHRSHKSYPIAEAMNTTTPRVRLLGVASAAIYGFDRGVKISGGGVVLVE